MKIFKITILSVVVLLLIYSRAEASNLQLLPWQKDESKSIYSLDTTDVKDFKGTCSNHHSSPVKGKVDIGLDSDDKILATEGGEIKRFNYSCNNQPSNCGGGWGNHIGIKHTDNRYTLYAHFSTITKDLKLGSKVSTGEVLGIAGDTGVADGVHLHFERWTCDEQKCSTYPLFYEATTQVHANEAGRLVCGTYKSQNSSCTPPNEGTWIVSESCKFTGSATAPENILVKNNSTLTITNGSELDIDFIKHNLSVEKGSTVLVEVGGQIF